VRQLLDEQRYAIGPEHHLLEHGVRHPPGAGDVLDEVERRLAR
jgi:hypothetical protein